MTDAPIGVLVAAVRVDAFETAYQAGSTWRLPVGAIGILCRLRYYSPGLRRFISPDPTGFAGSGTNLYAYVGDDPINGTDPTARWTARLAACWEDAAFARKRSLQVARTAG